MYDSYLRTYKAKSEWGWPRKDDIASSDESDCSTGDSISDDLECENVILDMSVQLKELMNRGKKN